MIRHSTQHADVSEYDTTNVAAPGFRATNIGAQSFLFSRAKLQSRSQYLLLLLIVAIGGLRIFATCRQLSQTFDEPAHVACGLELLSHGRYHYEPQHPPLARVMAAFPLYVAGVAGHDLPDMWQEGNAILGDGVTYQRNLMMARLGTLPFFVAACLGIFSLARRIGGPQLAIAAVLLFSVLPVVLAHGGVATTDMAATAAVIGTVTAIVYWLDGPTIPKSVLLGGILGLSLLTKFTVIPFLFLSLSITWMLKATYSRTTEVSNHPRRRKRAVALIIVFALFVMWAGYGFSLKPITYVANRPHHLVNRVFPENGTLHGLAERAVEMPLPLSEVGQGLAYVGYHFRNGHESYLLGQTGSHGWVAFFPVAILTKTPIPFLTFFLLGIAFLFLPKRRAHDWVDWVPFLCASAILAVCLPSSINIGLRHILPLFPFLAIVAAQGIILPLRQALVSRRVCLYGIVALGSCLLYSSFSSSPEYLSYFNFLASSHPEQVLVGSDLDWGQDIDALSRWCKENNVHRMSVAYFGSADLTRHGLPHVSDLPPFERREGIIAISLTRMQMGIAENGTIPSAGSNGYRWLDQYRPIARVGASILIYSIPK